MWRSIWCLIFGHTWGPVVEHAQWWQGYEDVTDTGGLTIAYQPCGPNDEDAFLDEWADRTCTCCGAVKKED